jgi:hypothetical protein
VDPWSSHSAVAAFKYRHKTREGHYEDSLPALNEDVRNVSEAWGCRPGLRPGDFSNAAFLRTRSYREKPEPR